MNTRPSRREAMRWMFSASLGTLTAEKLSSLAQQDISARSLRTIEELDRYQFSKSKLVSIAVSSEIKDDV